MLEHAAKAARGPRKMQTLDSMRLVEAAVAILVGKKFATLNLLPPGTIGAVTADNSIIASIFNEAKRWR